MSSRSTASGLVVWQHSSSGLLWLQLQACCLAVPVSELLLNGGNSWFSDGVGSKVTDHDKLLFTALTIQFTGPKQACSWPGFVCQRLSYGIHYPLTTHKPGLAAWTRSCWWSWITGIHLEENVRRSSLCWRPRYHWAKHLSTHQDWTQDEHQQLSTNPTWDTMCSCSTSLGGRVEATDGGECAALNFPESLPNFVGVFAA